MRLDMTVASFQQILFILLQFNINTEEMEMAFVERKLFSLIIRSLTKK